jgi:uncharacterized protein YaiI (UPF0178 family)
VKILVDADSFPRLAREIVLRASRRTGIQAVFAANRPIPGIAQGDAVMEVCAAEEGAADDRICQLAQAGDLVLTRDIPLASRLVAASVMVIDDRGRVYTKENIRERLSLRNFMLHLAENGLRDRGPPHYGAQELKAFADSFDHLLTALR